MRCGCAGVILAVHTPDGAPMNETAACLAHVDEVDWYTLALDADDGPAEPTMTPVLNPGGNDTTCNICKVFV